MYNILLVGAGGFIGAILRYTISGYVQKISGSVAFPYGTLAVNLLGCMAIGMLTRMDEMKGILSPEMRHIVGIGILGALTTFSTFSNETVNLINDRRLSLALLNMGGQLILGLLAVFAGRILIYYLWRE